MTFDIKNYRIPVQPGCYLYKDIKGNVIYVGKAKVLKNRVKSYFNNTSLEGKTRLLVSKIADVEFITTNNEVEALLLEQSLIHKYNPKFNIDLKGTIRYAYIKITDDAFPRIITSRKVDDKGEYYGPYTDGTARRQIIGALVRLFKIRTCVRLPKKVCLQYHIGNCQGPCEDFVTQQEYMINIMNAKRLLKGETSVMKKDLESLMKQASQERKYEIAKMYKEQLDAISYVQDKQTIDQARSNDQDVINWIIQDSKVYIQIFNVLKGVITSRHRFSFDMYDSVIEDFINHYYSIHYIPEEIILPDTKLLDNLDTIQEYLRETKRRKFSTHYLPKVDITVPQKGSKKELLTLVQQNIEIAAGYEPGLLELQKKLQLPTTPVSMDFFDISNLKNQYIVGACIRLENSYYFKNKYRKFKVKWQTGQDDFAAMQEVVYRRYNDALKKQEELPDLIIIDGGRGQLNAAIQALARLQLTIPIISIAKKEEELYIPGKPAPLRLDRKLPGINILIKGRDEVHRFVLAFNRKLRKEIFK